MNNVSSKEPGWVGVGGDSLLGTKMCGYRLRNLRQGHWIEGEKKIAYVLALRQETAAVSHGKMRDNQWRLAKITATA